MLAEAHSWTPEQVNQMDPDFIDELFAQKRARADHALAESGLTDEQRKAKQRRREIARKIEIMNRRERRGK